MAKTKHFRSRIQQRGILQSTVEIAQQYGHPKGDKVFLSKKTIDLALQDLDNERKSLLKARDQGGVTLIESDGRLITAYRLESFRKRLA